MAIGDAASTMSSEASRTHTTSPASAPNKGAGCHSGSVQLFVDRRVLSGQTYLLTNSPSLAHDIVPEHRRRPSVGLEERRESADRRRLPGAVGAEQAVDASLANTEASAAEPGVMSGGT